MADLLVYGNNPGGGTRGAVPLGRAHKVQYLHDSEGPREHEFGPGVRIELLTDGSVRLYHRKGKPLWFDDGD